MISFAEAQAEAARFKTGGAAPAPAPTASGDVYAQTVDKWIEPEEGFRAQPYQDVGGTATVGYGRTHGVVPNQVVNKESERQWAISHMKNELAPILGGTLGANQISPELMQSLLSYGYNAGAGVYTAPGMKEALMSGNEGAIRMALANGVATVNGQPNAGLLARRQREAGMAPQQQRRQPARQIRTIEDIIPEDMSFEDALEQARAYKPQQRRDDLTPSFQEAMDEANSYAGPAPVAEQPEDRGWAEEHLRIFGDSFARIGQNIVGLVTQLEQKAEEKFGGLGAIYWGENGLELVSADEWGELKKDETVADLGDIVKEEAPTPFDSSREGDGDKLYEMLKKGDIFNAEFWDETVTFGTETAAASIADMISMAVNIPLYVAQWAVDIGNDRAKNEGVEPDIGHTVDALPAAVIASMFEWHGIKGITNAGKVVAEEAGKKILKEGVKAGAVRVGKAGGKALVREAGTEFIQEQVEYAGEVVGTPAPFKPEESLKRGTLGAIGGGFAGGAGGTTFATVREVLRPPNVPKDIADPAETPVPEAGTPEAEAYVDYSAVGDGLDVETEEDVAHIASMAVLAKMKGVPSEADAVAERLAQQIGSQRAEKVIDKQLKKAVADINKQATKKAEPAKPAAPKAAKVAPAAEPAAPMDQAAFMQEEPAAVPEAVIDPNVQPALRTALEGASWALNQEAASTQGGDTSTNARLERAQALFTAVAAQKNELHKAGYDVDALLAVIDYPLNHGEATKKRPKRAGPQSTPFESAIGKEGKSTGKVSKAQLDGFFNGVVRELQALAVAGPVKAAEPLAGGAKQEIKPGAVGAKKARGIHAKKAAQKLTAEQEAENEKLHKERQRQLDKAKTEEDARIEAERTAAGQAAAEEAMAAAAKPTQKAADVVETKGQRLKRMAAEKKAKAKPAVKKSLGLKKPSARKPIKKPTRTKATGGYTATPETKATAKRAVEPQEEFFGEDVAAFMEETDATGGVTGAVTIEGEGDVDTMERADARGYEEKTEGGRQGLRPDKDTTTESRKKADVLDADPMLQNQHGEDIYDQRQEVIKMVRQMAETSPLTDNEEIGGEVFKIRSLELDELVNKLMGSLHKHDPYKEILKRIRDAQIDLRDILFDVITEKHAIALQEEERTRIHAETGVKPAKKPGALAGRYGANAIGDSHTVRWIQMVDKYMYSHIGLDVLVHELTHAAQKEAMRTNNNLAMKMEGLRQLVIKEVNNRGGDHKDWYGLTNVDEFLAEANSSAEFQELLADIHLPDGSTAWSKLVALIAKYIGIEVADTSVLAHVMAASPQLYQNSASIDYSVINKDLLHEYIRNYVGSTEDTAAPTQEELEEMADSGVDDPYSYKKVSGVLTANEQLKRKRRAIKDNLDVMESRRVDKGLGRAKQAANELGNGLPKRALDAANDMVGGRADADSKTRRLSLGFKTRDMMETDYARHYEGLGRDGGNPLTDYSRSIRLQQAMAKKFERAADTLHEDWIRTKKEKGGTTELSSVSNDATVHQVNPAYDWNHPKNAVAKGRKNFTASKVAHGKLRTRFKKLSSTQQKLFIKMENFYAETLQKQREAVVDNMIELYDLSGVRGLRNKFLTSPIADINAMLAPVTRQVVQKDGSIKYGAISAKSWKSIKRPIIELKKLTETNGPYFPQMRFGDFAVAYSQVTTKTGFSSKEAAGKKAADLRGSLPGSKTGNYTKVGNTWSFDLTETGFETFDTARETEARREELLQEGFDVDAVSKISDMPMGDTKAGAGLILAVAEKKLGKEDKDSVVALRSALVTMLPATSLQKRMLKRKNVAGAALDGHRAFANYAISAGHSLARLKHGSDVERSFIDLGQASKTASRRGQSGILVQEVYEEIAKRHGEVPKAGKLSQVAASMAFINYLMTLSYSAVNSTQTLLMTIPYLGGKFGSRKATAAVMNAYGKVGGNIARTVIGAKGGLAVLSKDPTKADLNNMVNEIIGKLGKNSGEGRMLEALADIGSIEATFSMEMAETAKGLSPNSAIFSKVLEIGRFMPYAVEVMNRSVTAIASYNLSIEAGATHEAAVEAARLAIVKTQFDYTTLNRPRHFVANDILRAMTMFKIHSLGLYSFLIHNTRQALHKKGATKEEARQARKALGLFIATHGAFAGLAGSVLMEPVKAALGALGMMFDDEGDDEEFLDDPATWIRRTAYEMTGSAKFAEVITKGLPRAFNFDMSSRVGLQNMMFMYTEGDSAVDTLMSTIGKSALGPVFGYKDAVSTSVAAMANGGSTSKALEYMAPKGIRDIMRALRYESTGMTDFNGNVIANPEEFSTWDFAVKVVGFSSSKEANIYDQRKLVKTPITKVRSKRTAMLRRFANATTKEERGEAVAAIEDFNNNLPPDMKRAYYIRRGDMIKRKASKRERERKTRQGVFLDPKDRFMRQRLEMFD